MKGRSGESWDWSWESSERVWRSSSFDKEAGLLTEVARSGLMFWIWGLFLFEPVKGFHGSFWLLISSESRDHPSEDEEKLV